MDAGSVDEDDLASAFSLPFRDVDNALDPAARGLRLGRNDREFLAHKRIEQRGLARIGPPENANETGFKWHKGSFELIVPSGSGCRMLRAVASYRPRNLKPVAFISVSTVVVERG